MPKGRGLLGLLTHCLTGAHGRQDDLFGKKWVQVFDPRGGGRGYASGSTKKSHFALHKAFTGCMSTLPRQQQLRLNCCVSAVCKSYRHDAVRQWTASL